MGVILSGIEYCCVLALSHLDACKRELMRDIPIAPLCWLSPERGSDKVLRKTEFANSRLALSSETTIRKWNAVSLCVMRCGEIALTR